jgi:hypothetical protein
MPPLCEKILLLLLSFVLKRINMMRTGKVSAIITKTTLFADRF